MSGGRLRLARGGAQPNGELTSLVDQVWEHGTDGPVHVSLGPVPASHTMVEQYAVLPSPGNARFLLPTRSRAVEVSSLRKFSAAKAPAIRAARASLAAVFAAGLGDRVFPHRLSVSIDRRVPAEQHQDWLVLSHLAAALDKDIVACLAVRRLRPNVKPTLQLFDPTGTPVGYTKLGWSKATRAMARAEADALADLDGGNDVLVTPKLLSTGDWRHYTYCVTSPLPESLRPWNIDPVRAPEIVREVLRSGPVYRSRLLGSAYAGRLRDELDRAAGAEPDAAAVLGHWLTRMEATQTLIDFGRWHGDWVPWNLASLGKRVVAWDWEHSALDTPAGFDILHWHFQHELNKRGLEAAVRRADVVADGLDVVGVPPSARRLVASLFLLDRFVRTTRLSIGGGGWNPRLYPQMLQVAAERDR